MDKAESLMSDFSELNYIFDKNMPKGQKGLNIEKYIYLNPKQTSYELNSTVAEEIGHYLTTVGDITKQDTNEKRKQERKARDVGSTLVVTPYDIIDCFEEGCKTAADCAEFLQVTVQTFKDAVSYYARRFDGIKTENNYTLLFKEDGTVGVLKTFDSF